MLSGMLWVWASASPVGRIFGLIQTEWKTGGPVYITENLNVYAFWAEIPLVVL